MAKNRKVHRELREMENLFKDPKYIRDVWRNVGNAMLRNPATVPVKSFNKDGDETYESRLQGYCYTTLRQDLQALGQDNREPTELEMILACQAVRARTDTSAAVFIRDTLGAKPVDESKVEQTVNQFEALSDEELELLAAHRAEVASRAAGGSTTPLADAEDTDEDVSDGNT